jgi:hypothetical protein
VYASSHNRKGRDLLNKMYTSPTSKSKYTTVCSRLINSFNNYPVALVMLVYYIFMGVLGFQGKRRGVSI